MAVSSSGKSGTYPFSAVLFDMNGVVVDNCWIQQAAWREFLRVYRLQPTEKEISATDGRRVCDIIVSLFGDSLDARLISRLCNEYEGVYFHQLRKEKMEPVAGLKTFCRDLHALRTPVVLATSASRAIASRTLGILELQNLFDILVSAEDVIEGKPRPDIFLRAAAACKVKPQDCLVVEDSVAGIQSGKAARMHCLGITTSLTGDVLRQAGADWLAKNFLELPKPVRIGSAIEQL